MLVYIVIGLIIFLAIALAIANYAPAYFKSVYKKVDRYVFEEGYTTGDFAIYLREKTGYNDITFAKSNGGVENCYFVPKSNTLVLNENTIDSKSVASFAVFVHEFGHAIQHNSGNAKYKVLNIMSAISIIFGRLVLPFTLTGIILMLLSINPEWIGYTLCIVGISIFVISFLVRLFTIFVEFEASRIGLDYLKEEGMDKKSLHLAKKLLKCAGLTYIGAFFASILSWTFLVPKYKN